MKIRSFERVQILPRAPEELFAFFRDAHNLKLLTPDFLHFEFVREPPSAFEPGTLLDYRIELFGIPVHWRTRIESIDPPARFVDVEDKGPYALWRNTHEFRRLEDGRTEMHDRVEFAMPLGPLGELAYHLFVAQMLERIYDYREQKLREIFGAPGSASVGPRR